MLGFKSFRCARVILGGIELMHMIAKGQTKSVVDEVYPLQGYVAVVRRSTLKEREYRIGHGTAWTVEFEKDLTQGAFG